MMSIRNTARERARVLHDMKDLEAAEPGSLWRESPVNPKEVGRDGGNPGYVIATGGKYIVVCADDGSGYTGEDEHGIFLPGEHQPGFPLTEVTDGTVVVFDNRAPEKIR